MDENRAFAEKFSFPFALLSDTDRAVGLSYGACDAADAGYAARITYVIAGDGTIKLAIADVDAKTQPETLLSEL